MGNGERPVHENEVDRDYAVLRILDLLFKVFFPMALLFAAAVAGTAIGTLGVLMFYAGRTVGLW